MSDPNELANAIHDFKQSTSGQARGLMNEVEAFLRKAAAPSVKTTEGGEKPDIQSGIKAPDIQSDISDAPSKEAVEGREWWICPNAPMGWRVLWKHKPEPHAWGREIVHVREVIEERKP